MRVKLDEINQVITDCPPYIKKTKTIIQTVEEINPVTTEVDGETVTTYETVYVDQNIEVEYDITNYQHSQESLDDGYQDIDDNLVNSFRQGKSIIKDGEIIDKPVDQVNVETQKEAQIELLMGQYTQEKQERYISWLQTFINSLLTVTTIEELNAKAQAFKTKSDALLNDYKQQISEVENG